MNLLHRSWLLSCGVAASTLVLALGAGAASFTIFNGQTISTTQTLNHNGG